MAIAGFPPLVFAVVALIDLLYQFWVHTEQVGRLGGFDRWFCAPSNHRVHHAVNDVYLDRNYGGVLLVWDRLFGTYAEEDPAVPCVYGTRAPLRSWNPIRANLQVYAELGRDSWRATPLARQAARLVRSRRAGGPADVAARWPKAPFVGRRLRALRSGRRRRAGRRSRCRAVRRLARRDDALPLARACARAGRSESAFALAIVARPLGRRPAERGRVAAGAAPIGPAPRRRQAPTAGIAMIEDRCRPRCSRRSPRTATAGRFAPRRSCSTRAIRAARSTSSSKGACAPTRARRKGATSSSRSTARASTSASCRSTARPDRRR